MDADRFDLLAKRLAKIDTSRRRLLKGLFGGMAGGLLGAAGPEAADAFICRQGGVLCAKDAQCCSGACVNFHCTCEVGQLPCGPRCCTAGQVCTDATAGACCTPTTCQAGQCGAVANGCGDTVVCDCPRGEICTSGQCVTTTTTTTTTTTSTTTTTTTTTTAAPCAPTCSGKACGASDGCGGSCQTGTCPAGEGCCGGTCTDLTTTSNCGACGNVCSACSGANTPFCFADVDGSHFCGGGGQCSTCSSDRDCLAVLSGSRCISRSGCRNGTACQVAC